MFIISDPPADTVAEWIKTAKVSELQRVQVLLAEKGIQLHIALPAPEYDYAAETPESQASSQPKQGPFNS